MPGVGWGTAAAIEPLNVVPADSQVLAVDAQGNALALWVRSGDVWSNHYTVGTGWGTPHALETGPVIAHSPRVAFDADGFATAVWIQDLAMGGPTVFANRYTPGVGWGTPAPIGTGTAQESGPQVAADAAGNAHALWHEHDGARLRAWTSLYTPAGGWGPAALLDNGDGNAFGSQLAVDAAGHAVAVWTQQTNLMASRYVPGTGWSVPALLETSNVGPALSSRVAMNAAGVAQVVWVQSDGVRENIWTTRFVPGAGWSTPVRVEDEPEVAYGANVAIDPAGNAVAIWIQNIGSTQRVNANVYR